MRPFNYDEWKKRYYQSLRRRMKRTGIIVPTIKECREFVDLNLTTPMNEKLMTPILLAKRLEETEVPRTGRPRVQVITWAEFLSIAEATFGPRPPGTTSNRGGWSTQLARVIGVGRRSLSYWSKADRVPITAALACIANTQKFEFKKNKSLAQWQMKKLEKPADEPS